MNGFAIRQTIYRKRKKKVYVILLRQTEYFGHELPLPYHKIPKAKIGSLQAGNSHIDLMENH